MPRASPSAAKLAAMGGKRRRTVKWVAIVNMRPDLFHAIVSVVPFVDVITPWLDESLPTHGAESSRNGVILTIKADYEYMRTYCPYTNLAKQKYPSMLVRTSLNDSQVMFWEPAKYTAKPARAESRCGCALPNQHVPPGHGGSSGRYDYLREVAARLRLPCCAN